MGIVMIEDEMAGIFKKGETIGRQEDETDLR